MANNLNRAVRENPVDETDDDLVAVCREELPYVTAAYERLVRRYEPVVFRTCSRYLRNDQEAEEASQDVFMRVFFNIVKFQGRSSFKTWLFRLTANVCATRYKSLRRSQSRLLDYATEISGTDGIGEPAADPFDLNDGPMALALDALNSRDREILILRHVGDLSFEEISTTLEIGLSAAKMRLYRAEQSLRRALSDPTPTPC